MCGIVGLIRQKDAAGAVLEALQRLEYRGYDSVGLGVIDHKLDVFRKEGKINVLLDSFQGQFPEGGTAIAHTRWATHGRPEVKNAHPLSDGGIAVVHNGIIENEASLRQELIKGGALFSSDTDTEVILRLLLEDGGKVEDALPRILPRLEGAFALAILDERERNRIFFARRHSPLVLGIGEKENWMASDLSAFLPETREVIFLEEDRWGWITEEDIEIRRNDGSPVKPQVKIFPWNPVSAQKGRFSHFMLKEIHEQPRAITDTLSDKLSPQGLHLSEDVVALLRKTKRIQCVACGTSFNATLAFRSWVENIAGIPCEVEIASESRNRPLFPSEGLLVIAVSQSGETFDTLKAVEPFLDAQVPVLSVVNTTGNSLERCSTAILRTHAGMEIGVAASKTHLAQLSTLFLVALQLAELGGTDISDELLALRRLPSVLETVLGMERDIKEIAQRFTATQNALFLGRQRHWSTAMEGSLKLKEISYIHAEAYAAGEMKHGPIALISKEMLVVIIAPFDDHFKKIYGSLREVAARKGRILLLTTKEAPEVSEAEITLVLPTTIPLLSAFPALVALQIFAYWIARERGLDIDQPRNLAKTVTVE
ncbi:glutamine--fructose-6-phosphate transaminase (isomerizing) [bacterium]|nr:glutamine--fructose-6-phosphate transaminase (isomerizing) [bacterium]